ncbi:carboxymuconolactone decarboxylase family protein [Microbacterium terregens]|uniref:Carboxymuconolactone decarboxylase family protein n=1 Tax=Microbacterium terregens TaxID=69363 RepID=A0ABV5T7D8_9MICO
MVAEDGQLLGPPAAWMLSPPVGIGLERAGFALRFALALPDRWREIVILMVAAHEDSAFERFAHRQGARAAGVTDAEIGQIQAGTFTPAGAVEAVLVQATTSLLRRAGLNAKEWSAAESALGHRAIFEVVTLVGWYRLMALQLRVFRLEPPTADAIHSET